MSAAPPVAPVSDTVSLSEPAQPTTARVASVKASFRNIGYSLVWVATIGLRT